MSVSGLAVYPWQGPLWQQLLEYVVLQRVPQALLISGSAGIGKRHLAEIYARSLLCHHPLTDHAACGVCQGCKLWEAQTHPDYILIEPEEPGKGIGIDKIRQLIVKLALKPQFSAYRVVIIEPADLMNTAAANAFLKSLEEPTERTCLLLLTDKPARLPATIRSRCQSLHCQTPDKAIAMQWLQQQAVKQNPELLLSLAQGAPLLARQYAENNLSSIREELFQNWMLVAEGKANLIALAEQWQKQDKLELSVLLKWMISWIADLTKMAYRADSHTLQNPDFKKSLQALAGRLELKQVYAFYDALLEAHSQLSSQINKQLMLEQLLIRWSQLTTG